MTELSNPTRLRKECHKNVKIPSFLGLAKVFYNGKQSGSALPNLSFLTWCVVSELIAVVAHPLPR